MDADGRAGLVLMTEGEFALLQALVHRESGIWLAPAKRAMLSARLARRLRELGLRSYAAYYRRAREDAGETERMLDCVCTNKTSFFRERRHFAFLEEVVFPQLCRRHEVDRRIRAWSAGCSTGEEPYSLAMHLLWHFPPEEGWQVTIEGTDLSTTALRAAATGCWSVEKAGDIPSPYLRRFMLRGVGRREGVMRAGPEIRDRVRFARLNLKDPDYGWRQSFDLVFCRNVLIYFDLATRVDVLRRVARHVDAGGYVFLGHAETATGVAGVLRQVRPTVYRPDTAAGAAM
jgi:chemotaxis protein methyltransferase CheR